MKKIIVLRINMIRAIIIYIYCQQLTLKRFFILDVNEGFLNDNKAW
jgi:hypothetical protein